MIREKIYIQVIGCQGSGKSTVMEAIARGLKSEGFNRDSMELEFIDEEISPARYDKCIASLNDEHHDLRIHIKEISLRRGASVKTVRGDNYPYHTTCRHCNTEVGKPHEPTCGWIWIQAEKTDA